PPQLAVAGLLLLWNGPAQAMHIAEGIIVGVPAVLYTLAGVALIGIGAARMRKFALELPEKRPLFGMGAAIIFFVSLIPLPAFTGTTSHPCGTPLVAVLLGPWIAIALTGLSLLLQAAFFAHGGFATWGANVIALGFFGCVFGWGTFRLARALGLPIFVAGCAAGLVGDVMVYAASGGILGITLANGPDAQYLFANYLSVIFAAYAPIQIPIALGEMLVTGFALRHALKQRPDVLRELNVWRKPGEN
ncbi:MAG: energy-coupling factor ABC transporter permease, partial [Gammaproteobacteria bacterium]